MNSNAKQSLKCNIFELVLFAILGAMTFALKVAMMGLPNIEPVSLMVMLFAVIFGKKAIYPTYIYILLEFMLYGLNLWSINYLYIWAVLLLLAWFMRESRSPLSWALLSGGYGLAFGALCTPVYMIVGGLKYGIAWWISGIPFDFLHGAGNFVIALVLFMPLRNAMEHIYNAFLSSFTGAKKATGNVSLNENAEEIISGSGVESKDGDVFSDEVSVMRDSKQ